MRPSTGPRGWHLASPKPPCCRVYGTWVCMEALHSLWCRVGCASRVSLLSVSRRGWLLSALGQQGLSIPAKTVSWNTCRSRLETTIYGPQRELLIATSTFFTCGLLFPTGAQYSATGNTRACVAIRSVLAEAPHVVPARRRMSGSLDVTFPATSSRCCLKFSIRSRRTPRYFWACWNTRRLLSTNSSNFRLASLLLRW